MAILAASCGPRGGKAAEDEVQADSTATTKTEMEEKIIEEPIFDIVTSKGTMRVKLYSKTISHKLSDHAIAFRTEKSGINRNEKEIYDAGEDGAQTINHSLPCQLFQRICHNEDKNSYFCRVKAKRI